MIDETDRQILNILQQNARTTNADIARQIGMAPSAVLERIRKLELKGVIQGYETRINPEALGLNLLAFVSVKTEEKLGQERSGDLLAKFPEVQEVHHIAGEDCFLVKVRVPDARSLGRLLREGFGALGSVRSTRTTVVLETIRESALVSVDVQAAPGEAKVEEEVYLD